MRVAIMIDSLAIGGAQKHVRQLACGLASEGTTVTVYVLNDLVSPVYVKPLEAAGVRVIVVGRSKVLTGLGLAQVVTDLWQSKCTLLLTVLFVSTIFGRIAALGVPGIRVITCLQARNVDYSLWQKALIRITARLAFWTISNSRSALAWAEQKEGVDLRRATFLANAVEVPDPLEPVLTWTSLGFPQLEKRLVVGSTGRLVQQKGFDLLIEAFAQVREKIPNAALLIVGEGPARRSLQQLRSKLRCETMVIFAGERTDVAQLIRNFAVYVQSSRFEGTPNALMEAMVVGCPVIGTRVDGIAELLRDVKSECLVAANDIDALHRTIYQMLADREAASIIGKMGQEVMRTHYSLHLMQQAYLLTLRVTAEVCG